MYFSIRTGHINYNENILVIAQGFKEGTVMVITAGSTVLHSRLLCTVKLLVCNSRIFTFCSKESVVSFFPRPLQERVNQSRQALQ